MNPLSHPQAQGLLLSGQPLLPEENASLSAHLESCPDCRAFADFHRSLRRDLPQAYYAASPAARHSEREIRQKAQAVQARLEKQHVTRWMVRGTQAAFMFTALLVMAFGLSYLLFRLLPASARPQAVSLAATQPASGPSPATGILTATNDPADTQPAPALPAEPSATTDKYQPPAVESGEDNIFGETITSGAPTGAPAPTAAPAATLPPQGEVAQPGAAQAPSALQAPALDFLLRPGTTWVYTRTGYEQGSSPSEIIQGVSEIRESVAEVTAYPAFTLVRIQGHKQMISQDAGWEENGVFPLGDYHYWYVIQGERVYWTTTAPDPANLQVEQLRLEFQLPFQTGAEWCKSSLRRGTVEQPTPGTDAPCESKRQVSAVSPYSTAIGELQTCYTLLDPTNSGAIISQFCEGVGIVDQRYDHSGTRFGYTQVLTSFTLGPQNAETSSPTQASPQPFTEQDLPLGGAVIGAAWSGHTAYIGDGPHLSAVDLSQPAAPRLIARSPALAEAVTKVIRLPDEAKPLVIAGAGRSLAVFDITNPALIDPLGQLELPGQIGSLMLDLNTRIVYAAGSLAAQGQPGASYIAMINLADATQPRLIDEIRLDGTIQGLALAKPVLYAGVNNGSSGSVLTLDTSGDRFSEPVELLASVPVYSLCAVRGQLYIGTTGGLLAYDISDPNRLTSPWKVETAGANQPLGTVYSFELRPNTIFTANFFAGSSQPVPLAVTPPQPLQTGSTVDTASYIAVGNGLMLVTGSSASDGLEIYDVLDPQNIRRIGVYRPGEQQP